MAWWIEAGRGVSAGSSSSSAASISRRSSSKNAGSFMRRLGLSAGTWAGRSAPVQASSGFFFAIRLKRLGGHFPIGLLQQNFDAAFGLLELFLALAGQLDALFEELHRFVEREVGVLELLHYLFESGQRALEVRLLRRFALLAWRRVHSKPYLAPASSLATSAKITRSPTLLNAPDPGAAPPATLALAVIHTKQAFQSLEPPVRIAKIRCWMKAAF